MIAKQTVRLIDVFAIGPFLIYAATANKISNPIRLALLGIGIATVIYNGVNYLKKEN